MKTYLSIDFGLKRIGLAINRLWLAEPIKTVDISVAINAITKLLQDEQIDEILIGISDGEIAKAARAFAQDLRKNTSIPITEVDETLSTKEADAFVLQSGMSQSKRRGARDHFAAAVFLQEYIDLKKYGLSAREYYKQKNEFYNKVVALRKL